MDLIFNVNGQVIKPNKKYEIYSDMKNYLTAVFRFSDDWDGLEKTALFISADGTVYKMLLVNDECTVPWEVIDTPSFGISVYGGDLMTANLYLMTVHESGYTDAGVDPAEPTPDIYNQLVETVQAERNLALAAADLANTKAALADEKAIAANTAAEAANTAADLANTKAALADEKAIYADEQGDYALEQGGYALEQGGYAESIVNTINVNGIVKGDGAGNFSAADAGDMPITDEDEHFTAGTVEGALAEAGEHMADTDNPHGVTATQLGLGNVDNTADVDKPISTATQAALDLKADNTDLSDTNLRIVEVNKSLSNYQNAIASINVNQSPKQTASGYGTVSLPVNAANGQVSVSVKGNTVTDENGTNSTVSAGRLVSENEDETERTEMYIPDVGVLRSGGLFNLADNGEDYENWTVDAGISKSAEGLSTSILGYAELPVNLKPSTVYTLVYRASIPIYCAIVVQNNLQGTQVNLLDGFHKIKITTKSSITDSNLRLLFGIAGTKTITFALYGIYEGDQTSNPDVNEPQPYGGSDSMYDEIAYNKQSGQYEKIQRIDDEGEPLSAPITTPIAVSGTLIGHPKGTVYFEPVLAVAGIYAADGISVTNEDFAIDTLERIAKIDFMTGVETEVDVSQAVIAGDGLSFTHPDLIDGDIVFFTYYHAVEGTQPEIDVEYYDSRYTVEDSAVSGTFYAWKVTVTNGTPTLSVEVV